jgi:hypothetical protein
VLSTAILGREETMKYALLIYGGQETHSAALGEEERAAMHEAYASFTKELQASGAMTGGEPLQGTETATTVRVRNGETLTTDGPFAETKETLGGFYLVDVDTIDEAIEWASKIPGALYGSIEVRPLMELPAELYS